MLDSGKVPIRSSRCVCSTYGGCFVSALVPNSRASMLGLLRNDRILAVGALSLMGTTHARAAAILTAVGGRVDLLVLRPPAEEWVRICRQARAMDAKVINQVSKGKRAGCIVGQCKEPVLTIP